MEYVEIVAPFRITGIGSVQTRSFAPSFVFSGERHCFWEFFAVLSGEVEVVEDETTYLLSENDIIFHAPHEFHRLKSAGGTAPQSITVSLLHEGALPEKLKGGVFHLSDELKKELASIAAQLESALGGNYDGGVCFDTLTATRRGEMENALLFEATLRLSRFLLVTSRLNESEERVSNTAGARLYRQIVRTMTERVRDGLTLTALAEIHYVSQSYIKKLFSTYAGIAPSVYYARLRINEAKQLLREKSVCEVADILHFSSAAHFSAYFKKQTGERASDYKKKGEVFP